MQDIAYVKQTVGNGEPGYAVHACRRHTDRVFSPNREGSLS